MICAWKAPRYWLCLPELCRKWVLPWGDSTWLHCILSWEALNRLLISVPLQRTVIPGCCEGIFSSGFMKLEFRGWMKCFLEQKAACKRHLHLLGRRVYTKPDGSKDGSLKRWSIVHLCHVSYLWVSEDQASRLAVGGVASHHKNI